MLTPAEALCYMSGVWSPLVEGLSSALRESLGDTPEWLRIRYYRADQNNPSKVAETILQIKGKRGWKDYWFPVSPTVMEKFVTMASKGSRGAALMYLREYVRKYRGYNGTWPNKPYVQANAITPSMMTGAGLPRGQARRPTAADDVWGR